MPAWFVILSGHLQNCPAKFPIQQANKTGILFVMGIQFTWDSQKATHNAKKHEDVRFEEATAVFRDPFACIFDDEAHSEEEYRELIIGYSNRNRLLIISFTERNDVIRIISARKTNVDERADYENTKR